MIAQTETFESMGDLTGSYWAGLSVREAVESGRLLLGEAGHRTTGWHVANILRGIAIEARIVDWGQEEEDECLRASGWEGTEDSRKFVSNLRMEAGVAWEPHLFHKLSLAERQKEMLIHQPGEHVLLAGRSRQPVYMSPDGYNLGVEWPDGSGIHQCVDECKFSWYSANKGLNEFWLYLAQVKSYALALGVTRARLCIYHANGVYEKFVVGAPLLRVHWLEFTEHELAQNWGLVGHWVDRFPEGRKILK